MKNIIRSFNYSKAQAEKRAAFNAYNAASIALQNAQIGERAAELGSQSFESIAQGKLQKTVGEISDREREIGLAFVRYAVYGRSDKE